MCSILGRWKGFEGTEKVWSVVTDHWVYCLFAFWNLPPLPQMAQVFPALLQDAQGLGKGSKTAKPTLGFSHGLRGSCAQTRCCRSATTLLSTSFPHAGHVCAPTHSTAINTCTRMSSVCSHISSKTKSLWSIAFGHTLCLEQLSKG